MSQGLVAQLVNGLAALMLLVSFALLAQHRMRSVLHWFAAQGWLLAATAALVAFGTGNRELFVSAALTLALKGVLLPWILWWLIERLDIHREVEPLVNLPATMLIAIAVTLFSFHVIQPIERIAEPLTRQSMAIATACVLLGVLMMITRRKAVTQVVGFLAVENALFFAAIGSTGGMPLVVEIGVAFDVLIAALILGLFFFQIRTTFDSLEVDAMEASLVEREDGE